MCIRDSGQGTCVPYERVTVFHAALAKTKHCWTVVQHQRLDTLVELGYEHWCCRVDSHRSCGGLQLNRFGRGMLVQAGRGHMLTADQVESRSGIEYPLHWCRTGKESCWTRKRRRRYDFGKTQRVLLGCGQRVQTVLNGHERLRVAVQVALAFNTDIRPSFRVAQRRSEGSGALHRTHLSETRLFSRGKGCSGKSRQRGKGRRGGARGPRLRKRGSAAESLSRGGGSAGGGTAFAFALAPTRRRPVLGPTRGWWSGFARKGRSRCRRPGPMAVSTLTSEPARSTRLKLQAYAPRAGILRSGPATSFFGREGTVLEPA